jgi:hypothetical protein
MAADDKQFDVAALKTLLARPDVDQRTRRQLTDELWNIRTGERTEREARYEIELPPSAAHYCSPTASRGSGGMQVFHGDAAHLVPAHGI